MKSITLPWLSALALSVSLAFSLAFSLQTAAQDCMPEHGVDHQFVYDYAQLISEQDEAAIQGYLARFTDSTHHAIVVVTHDDLCGLEPAEFSVQLGRRWGVGIAEENNGIVLAVRPKSASERGGVFIAVGYGLEGEVTDLETGRIIDNVLIPAFKQGDYTAGIAGAVQVLAELASGELAEYTGGGAPAEAPVGFFFLPFLIMGLFMLIRVMTARKYAASHGMGFWAAWALITAAQRSQRGSYGHFRGGTGGFGGGGGGGFGGFGGGSFGGGGAGGSW
jgi:uncharacterized protein